MLSALRHRPYRLFWTGNFLSNIGNWMQTLAVGWLVLQLTNSVFLLGLVGFSSSLPSLFFSLVGGVMADRSDRKRMMMITQSAMMALAFLLSLLSYLQIITVWEILLISFLAGVDNAMNAPAYQAIVPELVPPSDLTNAIAMNSTQFNLSRIVGPMIAGFTLKYTGSAGCFFLNALSFLALLFALTRLDLVPPAAHATRGIWRPMRDGFRYIATRPDLAMLLGLVSIVSLCAIPYLSLAPYFARDILHMGPDGLGYLMSAAGLGAITGAFLLARFGDAPRKGMRLLRGVWIIFASLIVFAFARSIFLSMTAVFFCGVAMVTAVSACNNLLQKHVQPEMRGRVMSMHATAFLGFAPIGSLIAGALGDVFGAPAAIATLCIAALVATLTVPLWMPEVLELA
jgi:MFS family permease